jgi:BirA family biotin operon repressor/biotin-[acetyl-CoA-carboxylase] ligase
MSELNDQGNKLLSLLADGEFHSGEKIGQLLGVSRTSVNNYIKALQEIGLDIYKVTGKGYCSAAPLSLLNAKTIKAISGIEHVHVEQILESTNQYLLNKLPSLINGQTCIAEYQSAGRGRRGRHWISPFASHLYFSMYWRLEAGIEKASGLSLLVGIATVNALEKLGVQGVGLKWPNDLYYQGKKLAGILIELNAQASDVCHAVIGIGLNVRMPEHQGKFIDQPWVDLNTISSTPIDRNQLSGLLIKELHQLLAAYEQSGLAPFLSRWFALDCFINQQVNLIVADKIQTGICKGINEQGALLLEINQEVKAYIGGEISLRLANN